MRRAMGQAKAADGYRYTRWAIVRQTLKQLKDTVLKDAQSWFAGLGEWRVSENTYYLNFSDVQAELVFIPLENAEDQARLLSMQLTGAWLSEAIEMNIDVIAPVSGRIGRYPSGNRGMPTWFGIIADTNMPVEMSDWHKFMTEPPPDWQVFVQPSGMAPNAENLNFLLQNDETSRLPIDHPDRLKQGRKYYERFLDMYGSDHAWVKRYVYAQYGDDPSGEAVFKASFRPSFHVVDDTFVIPGYPLIVGQDFGRNPWSLIGQVDHLGRVLIHLEVPAVNVGLEKHVEEQLRPKLFSDKFLSSKVIIVGDPSGVARGSIAEETCFDALKRMGLPAFPAPTNDIEPRLRSVETLLGRQVNAGPAIMISRKGCPWLVRAMSGGYRYKKHKDGALRTVPEKFDKEGFSHIADCLQYICLVVHGGLVHEFARRLMPRSRQQWRPPVTAAGWT
ncbi:MAG TPA: hypothetical protein VF077_09970 [Nitrospiraceae bacterium]